MLPDANMDDCQTDVTDVDQEPFGLLPYVRLRTAISLYHHDPISEIMQDSVLSGIDMLDQYPEVGPPRSPNPANLQVCRCMYL